MDSFMEELFQTFRDESTEIFEGLDKNLLELEKNPRNQEIITTVFRLIHTLKGSANMMGLSGTGKLAHGMEDLLDSIRSGKKNADRDLVNLFFDTVDCLKSSVQAEIDGNPLPEGHNALITILHNESLKKDSPETTDSTSATEEMDTELLNRITEAQQAGKSVFEAVIRFDELCAMKSAGAMLVVESLREKFDLLSVNPEHDSQEIDEVDFFTIILAAGNAQQELIIDSALVPGMVETVELSEKTLMPSQPVEKEIQAEPLKRLENDEEASFNNNHEDETLRVNWEQLVHLMNYVEELFVGRAKFQQTIGEILKETGQDPSVSTLLASYRSMDKLIGRIQEKVMDIRRIPLGVELNRFNRIIRDISVRHGKDVRLDLQCKNVEIDRGQWEELSGVLIDVISVLIRDSIESPRNRASAGKPATSSLQVTARYSSSDIVIDLTDDGVWCFESLQEIQDDINERLKKIRGRFEIGSGEHNDCLCRLRIPTNSATVGVLLVRRDDETFAVAMSAVREVVKYRFDETRSIRGKAVLPYKGRAVPIRSFSEVFPRFAHYGEEQKTSSLGIVLHDGERESIIEVDEIIGEDEILIKELRGEALQSSYIQGVTILGNGRVIIILNHRAFL